MSEEISSINYKIEALTTKIGELTTALKEVRDKIPSSDYWLKKDHFDTRMTAVETKISEIKSACSK